MGCLIRPNASRSPSRSSATGTRPAPVSRVTASVPRAAATTNAVPEDRMPREGKLGARGEDPDPDVAAFGRREEEDGLGDVQLPRQALHLSR